MREKRENFSQKKKEIQVGKYTFEFDGDTLVSVIFDGQAQSDFDSCKQAAEKINQKGARRGNLSTVPEQGELF
ncbi:hypothetical protein C4572_04285 [Candidatus Parcubacteria bacterium]|nr:MAG: hypothetical protein C4572_04285 [Candidatus Parcubacteria bacterium]